MDAYSVYVAGRSGLIKKTAKGATRRALSSIYDSVQRILRDPSQITLDYRQLPGGFEATVGRSGIGGKRSTRPIRSYSGRLKTTPEGWGAEVGLNEKKIRVGRDLRQPPPPEPPKGKPSRIPWLVAGGAGVLGAGVIGRATAPSRRHQDGSYNIPQSYW